MDLDEYFKVPYLPVDTEGSLNHPFSFTMGVSTSANGITQYFPTDHAISKNLETHQIKRLATALENHPCLVFHNAKHDLKALRNIGCEYQGRFYDTMLMGHMINENMLSKELDFMSKYYGGQPKQKTFEWSGTEWDRYKVPEQVGPYAEHDAFITEELFYKLLPEFKEQELDGELWDVEQEWVRLIMEMEDNGVLIDQSLCEQELERGLGIMKDLQKELGFNPASPKDLERLLIDELSLPVVKRTDKGAISFDKDAMEIYDEMLSFRDDKRAKQILAYRGWQKTTSSNYKPYLKLLGPDGRLHPSYKIHGTKTSRLSCEKPNLQQIPKMSKKDWNGLLKKAFIEESGRVSYEFDYSQLEFRLGAAYAKEQELIDAFNDPDRDVFSEMAARLGFDRDRTKTFNYAIQYGAGIDRISGLFGVSKGAAKGFIDQYYGQYPGLRIMTNFCEEVAKNRGYIKYWTGRRRHFPYQNDAHKAFNSAIQGGGFEIVKRSMIQAKRDGLFDDICQLNLQVHDSVRVSIVKGHEGEYLPALQEVLENTAPKEFGVKFNVEKKVWAT